MVNRHRGEIEAILDGKSYRLCLTLGALAELEHAFGEDDMLAVAERFEAGRIAAKRRHPHHRRGLARRGLRARRRGGGGDAGRRRRGRLCRYRGAAARRDLHRARHGEGSGPLGERHAARARASGGAEPFPWDAAMASGLGALRLAPGGFWAMTPRELDAACAARSGLSRMRRR